jgi:hypothetical protein
MNEEYTMKDPHQFAILFQKFLETEHWKEYTSYCFWTRFTKGT